MTNVMAADARTGTFVIRHFSFVILEVSFSFLFFHRALLVVVDDSALALAGFGEQHFLDDFRQRGGGRFDRAGQRVTAERAEADDLFHGLLVRAASARRRP